MRNTEDTDKPERAIKAVFFDIGNVLLKFDAARLARHIARVSRGHSLSVARLLLSGRLSDEIERGLIPPRGIFRLLKREMGFAGDYARFRGIWCAHFELVERTAGLLRRAAARRRVYLLSNTNAIHYDHIRRRYAFARHVRGAVLSHRLGLRKPEPGIYLSALRRARVHPAESLFIDDLAANVAAARKLGMHAVRYRGAARLEKTLLAFGVV
ncbi:MAG: HAD family phosphatase [Elusimicrobiota bacterium]